MKSSKTGIEIFILGIAIASTAFTASKAYGGKIIYPWNATSRIVKSGGEFPVGYAGATGETISSATLVGPYNEVDLSVKSVNTGVVAYDDQTGAATSHEIILAVPLDAPIEMYNLVLHTSTGNYTSVKSVKVIKNFKTRYYLAHITDVHIGGAQVWDASTAREMQYFHHILKEMEIIMPEMIVFSGDNVQNNTAKPLAMKWENFYNGSGGFLGIHGISVPTIVSTGNHDLDVAIHASSEWNKYSGMRVFGHAYGNTRFLVFDDFLADFDTLPTDFPVKQGIRLKAFLAKEGTGTLRIGVEHTVTLLDESFYTAQNIQFGLYGHAHQNFKTALSSGEGWTTGSAAHYSYVGVPNIGWFRLMIVDGDSVVSNETLQFGNTNALSEDLRLTFANPNDGKANTNVATLANDMRVGFESCRIRFVMAKGAYTVHGGTMEQTIDNDTVTVIDVRVKVATKAQAKVTLTPVSISLHKKNSLPGIDSRFTVHPASLDGNVAVEFNLPEAAHIRCEILDLLGHRQAMLADEVSGKGRHEMVWNGKDFRNRPVLGAVFIARLEVAPLVARGKPALFQARVDLSGF